MAEDLSSTCARCGHTRREHAEFIDGGLGSTGCAPQRRACQHHTVEYIKEVGTDKKTERKNYDCSCVYFCETAADIREPTKPNVPKKAVNPNRWLKQYLEPLVGSKIVSVGVSRDGFPIINVEMGKKSGITTKLEISRDAEGNGPGFIFGLPHVVVKR